ncbi:Origin recognition complex subunit 3 [Dimargaris verticillata]|uniref:Origin recognition complex subunit 3 n=1 Tax=Dimargaris verticillata TaxID=2761393 RepID=A0A9W8B3F0_9FUNG|nr:Origin recognition complex subunit 3 [Dimargaris verticillata]
MANVDAFDSVSEGCFVLKPKPKSQRLTRKGTDVPFAKYDGFCKLINGTESDQLVALRHQLYSSVWTAIQIEIAQTLDRVNQTELGQLTDWFDRLNGPSVSNVALPVQEIPTVALLAGINIQDHDLLYARIATHLQQTHQSLVVRLHSKDCATIKTALTAIIQQTMDAGRRAWPGDPDHAQFDANAALAKKSGHHAPAKYDIQYLIHWYEHFGCWCSPSDSAKVVLILQDFEGFDYAVLEQMIQILSGHLDRLPVTLIFGIATSVDMVHQALPKHITGLLRMEALSLQLSTKAVDALVETVVIPSQWGFALGYKPYNYLMRQFALHNFSVAGVVSTLQFAIMAYFYSSPLSPLAALLAKHPDPRVQKVACLTWTTLLSKDHLEMIRMQPSLRMYLESLDLAPKALYSLLDDNHAFFQQHVLPLIDRINVHQQMYALGLQCFHHLQGVCESKALCKPMRILHLFALTEDLPCTKHYEAVFQAFRRQDRAAVCRCLEVCHQTFTASSRISTQTTCLATLVRMTLVLIQALRDQPSMSYRVAETIIKADTFISGEDVVVLQAAAVSDEAANHGDGPPAAGKLSQAHPGAANPLLQSLLTGTNKDTTQSPRSTPQRINRRLMQLSDKARDLSDEQLRWLQLAYDCLDRIFRETLRCYDKLPLHELFYYDNVLLLKRAFNAQPRATIQTALSQPSHYLGCHCCKQHLEANAMSASHDDTCVLYKLYQECGRMINLYDWFTAFASIKESEPHHPSPGELQARFIRGVSELQFLGFIKPTSRKTDHVLRLTWGTV